MDSFRNRIEKAFGTHRGAKSLAARTLGVAQPQLSLAMTGKRAPSNDMLLRLEQYENGLPVQTARVKSICARLAPPPLPVAADDSTPASRAATVRSLLFDLMDRLQENGWTGRDMAAAAPELFRAWRAR